MWYDAITCHDSHPPSLLSCPSIILTGKPREKLHFIFNIFDGEKRGKLEAAQLKQFLVKSELASDAKDSGVDRSLHELFSVNEVIELEDFISFFLRHRDSPIISWFDKLATTLTQPPAPVADEQENGGAYRSKRQDIVAETKFSEKEVEELEEKFKALKATGKVNKFDLHVFLRTFAGPSTSSGEALLSSLFYALDCGKTGSLDVTDFIRGLSIICRGTLQQRLELSFDVFDVNKDGFVSKSEMKHVLSLLIPSDSLPSAADSSEEKEDAGSEAAEEVMSIRYGPC
jgi:Ca2+-binding EF-hand superfamily protein